MFLTRIPTFSFNGSSSNISVSDDAIIEPGSGNFSVEAWVRFGALKNQVIVGKIDKVECILYGLCITNGY